MHAHLYRMAKDTPLQIEIIDEIGGWGYTFKDLYATAKDFRGDNIRVVINSFGGSVLEGLLIFNYLKGHKARVETHIPAYAMSMGTIIAAAGDYVTMADNGYFMIHNPWAIQWGDHRDMEHMGQLMLQMKQDLASIYVGRTGKTMEEITALMDAETWLTPQQALDMGFIDEITHGAKFEASFDPKIFAQFTNVPADVLAQKTDMNTGNQTDEKKSLLAKLAEFLAISTTPAAEPEITVEALQAKVDELQGHIAPLAAQVQSLTDALATLTTERDTLAARVSELEAEPAAADTAGRNDGDPGTPEVKSYHRNPIFIEAKKRYGQNNA